MSRAANVDIAWADGTYPFRLAIGQLRELQEKCDAGPQELVRRLATGSWRVDDVRETLRQGLIGGGMKRADADKMIQQYVDEQPLLESVLPASVVLHAALSGVPDEEVGKDQPAGATSETLTMGDLPLPASLGPQPS